MPIAGSILAPSTIWAKTRYVAQFEKEVVLYHSEASSSGLYAFCSLLRRRSTLKGVDRAKRDEMIDAWASKQAAMRRAMQAVPSIRDFYEPPPESPPRDRKVYAPADLR